MLPAPILAVQVMCYLPASAQSHRAACVCPSSKGSFFLSLRKELKWFLQSLNLVAMGFFVGGIRKKTSLLLLLFPSAEFNSNHCQLQILMLLTVTYITARVTGAHSFALKMPMYK